MHSMMVRWDCILLDFVKARPRERMEAMYGINGQIRDAITDYSTPASGSFYFAPSMEMLDKL